MATLTPSTTSRTGTNITTAATSATAAGDKWANDGTQLLLVINADGADKVVTLVFGTGAVVDGQTPASPTVTVTTLDTALIGPFPTSIYNDASGFMNVTYNASTNTKVLVVTPGS